MFNLQNTYSTSPGGEEVHVGSYGYLVIKNTKRC